MSVDKPPIDPSVQGTLLDADSAPRLWRSLDELAGSAEFEAFARAEFPAAWDGSVALGSTGRREFLRLMGASLGLAGLTACVKPSEEHRVPYARSPENLAPGKPRFFTTTLTQGGYGTGVLVETHGDRPTRVDGNPEHPASLGAADIWSQAAVLQLYDPDRSRSVKENGRVSAWDRCWAELGPALEALRPKGGKGLRILTESITSPTLAAQLERLLEALPEARWHQWEPVHRDNARAGAILSFGEPVETQLRPENADVIVSFGADLLGTMPGHLRHAREFAKGRAWTFREGDRFRRLYVIESSPTITGSVADHRIAARAQDVGMWLETVAAGLKLPGAVAHPEADPKLVAAIVGDLEMHAGRGLIVVGDAQPAEMHTLAHWLNAALSNVGSTVVYTRPVAARSVQMLESLNELSNAIKAREVDTLLILGANVAYTAPADFAFAEALKSVRLTAHFGLYEDETARLCRWHVPSRHPFEEWGDARAFDGTASIVQPLIAPLYQGRSFLELIAAIRGEPATDRELVEAHWRSEAPADADWERTWERTLHAGVVDDSYFAQVSFNPAPIKREPLELEGLEVTFAPDPTVWDGTWANSGWLQELAKPLTKLTWSNAALVAPRTAERLGVTSGDLLEIEVDERRLSAPAWILPGQAEGSIALSLGYGRRAAGQLGDGLGHDAYALRGSRTQYIAGAKVKKAAGRQALVSTQAHHSMEGRSLVRSASVGRYVLDPSFARGPSERAASLPILSERAEAKGPQWGMSINLGTCIGCNACVIACQAENNIAVVGAEQVARGREMAWLRIDRYFEGSLDGPRIHWQPVTCVHCEDAPCEAACPTSATETGPDGVNRMMYDRCIGTRLCASSCPYKVRRFNFRPHAHPGAEAQRAQRNPDVTVRGRGVMEKCTYCVQRISAARIVADQERRALRDGEVKTACQSACPTQAITFGDLLDPAAAVSLEKASALSYSLLGELNTRPRTTYLAKLTNPSPAFERPEG
jgi:MoCo/4Fe-4S cofactor protein with predicted Tat translocation signal